MLHLRDLLPAGKKVGIEYRCNAPKCDDDDDMLFGFCSWDGEELFSEDGDNILKVRKQNGLIVIH